MQGKDILTAYQFSLQELNLIMNTAAHYEYLVQKKQVIRDMEGWLVASLFFEPSTRTRMSFDSAINRLGARVISLGEPNLSSLAKGETMEDTIRMVDSYADIIVMRHPKKGSARTAADIARVPVINGGDGTGQHPTQALLDIYTIRKERGYLGGQTITILGDLKYGRPSHSLAYFMEMYRNRMIFASPEALRMPEDIVADLRARGAMIEETQDVEAALAVSDIVYVMRVMKERFQDPQEYEAVKGSYILDRNLLAKAKPGITILHPLPRVDEMPVEVDDYEGAAYFRQAENGVYIRMALLALVSGCI